MGSCQESIDIFCGGVGVEGILLDLRNEENDEGNCRQQVQTTLSRGLAEKRRREIGPWLEEEVNKKHFVFIFRVAETSRSKKDAMYVL